MKLEDFTYLNKVNIKRIFPNNGILKPNNYFKNSALCFILRIILIFEIMEIIIFFCEFHFSIEWGHYIILCKAVGFDQVEVSS